jgi:acyl-CoA thioesterase
MSTWKKLSDKEKLILELKFQLAYCLKWNIANIDLLCKVDKKSKFKNYWLQKKEDKDHDNKLDKIAEFVTKYIKTQTKG